MLASSLFLLVVLVVTFVNSGCVQSAQTVINAALVNGEESNWKDEIPSSQELARSARMAALVYQVDSINSESWQYNKDPLIPTAWLRHAPTGTEAAVVLLPNTKTIHVVFRGTDGQPEDTMTDLKFRGIPYADETTTPSSSNDNNVPIIKGKVHKGFKESVFSGQSFLQQLDAAVLDVKQQHPNYQIEMNGHSLGGAQSTLYSVYLSTVVLPSENIRVMTIGCPRMGDSDFKASVNAIPNLAIWRVVNRDDIMTRIPFNAMMDYHHVGHMIHLKKDGRVQAYYQQNGLEDVYEGVDIDEWFPDSFWSNPLFPIMNHLPWQYELLLTHIEATKWPTGFEVSDGISDSCCLWVVVCLRQCKE